MDFKKKRSAPFGIEQDELPYTPFSRVEPTAFVVPAAAAAPEENFDAENIQKITIGAQLETESGLIIQNQNSRLEISEYNWFGYNSKTLLVGEKSTINFSLGSQGMTDFSLDYFALHNSKTVVNFYDASGNLIGSEKLLYTGSVSARQFVIKTLHFTAPARSFIARAELVSGDEPSVGDYGFHIDNVKWTTAGLMPVTFTFDHMGKDSGSSSTDFITKDGSAGRQVEGTLSRTLSASETLQLWDGTKWVNAKVTGMSWQAQDNVAHTADWEYKLRVIDSTGQISPEESQLVVLDITPSDVQVIFDHMSKDDGVAGDWRTTDGSAGRDVFGKLSKALSKGDVVEYTLDGGKTWKVLTVNGLNWSFTDSVNHTANWEYQIRITDIAGNISAPYKQQATLESKLAEVTIEAITKDSGFGTRDSDFLTRDGTAGRLVRGSISENLKPGEKVQVSFDNGATWHDAQHDGKKWFAVDNAIHNADWVIKARTVNASSIGKEDQQTVHYSPIKVASPEIAWDGKQLIAKLTATAVEGEKLQFMVEGKSMVVNLTAADIASGTATLPLDASKIGNPQDIRASYIDIIGNNSEWRVLKPVLKHQYLENFNKQYATYIKVGDEFVFDTFVLKAISVSNGSFSNRFGNTNQGGIGKPPTSMALEIANGGGRTSYKIDIKNGKLANKISFLVGDLNISETITAIFYDATGKPVRTLKQGGTQSADIKTLEFELPFGEVFSSMEFTLNYSQWSYVWLDDVKLSYVDYIPQSYTEAPSHLQTISQSTLYMGSDTDDVFQLSDASYLSSNDFFLRGQGGIDTLQLTGKNINLDLTALAGKVQSTEIINLTGTGNNTLSLSLGDVLQQGGKDLFNHSGNVQMMVKGNAGDKVNLSDLLPESGDVGDWNNSGNVTVGGVVYAVWQHSALDAALLVQNGVTTNLLNH